MKIKFKSMKKLALIALVILSSIAVKSQEVEELNQVPLAFTGVWKNLDNEFLKIRLNGEFERRSKTGKLLSKGNIEIIDGDIKVIRQDTADSYSLDFNVTQHTLVVMKPHDNQHAWLFERVGY